MGDGASEALPSCSPPVATLAVITSATCVVGLRRANQRHAKNFFAL